MYSLHLIVPPSEDPEHISVELWEAGTEGIQEIYTAADEPLRLIAGFNTNENREDLLTRFAHYSPEWRQFDATDWVAKTEAAWPAREVGEKIFLAPPWNKDPTPSGRVRVVHNPGLACGTGEHPCTRLALIALEQCVFAGCRVVDIGTGSGILAIAALRLGATSALGVDPDEATLIAARKNFELNGLCATLAAGSADCIAASAAEITIANINATVLLSILDDLLLCTRPAGSLILTGFTEDELTAVLANFDEYAILGIDEWRCVIVTLS